MNKIKKKFKKSFQLSIFGSSIIDKSALFILPFWISLGKKFTFIPNFKVRVRIVLRGRLATIKISDAYDYDTLYDIFVNREYFFEKDFLPKVIFDLGGHVGYTAIYFHLMYPDSTIYVFEPSHDNFQKLKDNTSNIKEIKIFNIAVASASGQVPFYHNRKKSTSSSLVARASDQPSEIVEAKTIDQLMSDLKISHIDLLKFDIEGSEYGVFKNSSRLSDIQVLIGEVHPNLIGVGLDEFSSLFADFKVLIDQKTPEKSKFLATK